MTTHMGKILVIEDAEPLRNDVIEMLNFEGYEVQGAENGVVGVDMVQQYHPDLIICDIMMPELDGYGVLEKLRTNPETASIPFIFLTAKTDRTDVRQGMGLGADDYLTKPFVASELLSTIQARLQKSRTLRSLVESRVRELSDSIITALPHELRTPLNTIIGFSDMLSIEARRLEPDQVVEWSSHINDAAQRLYRLVENYLLYVRAEIVSRNEQERDVMRQSVLHHPSAVLQFQAVNKVQIAERDDDFIFTAQEEEIAIHMTDYDLSKVVEEVVDNALKFSEPGQKIEVTATVEPPHYVLTCRDEGRGMSYEQIEHIGVHMQFDRWFYEQQGSGLGLAIVKRLLDVYGGEISVESEPDSGTTVTIRLLLAS
jgi:two-component system, sensor histidine kinase and response regulator